MIMITEKFLGLLAEEREALDTFTFSQGLVRATVSHIFPFFRACEHELIRIRNPPTDFAKYIF